MTHFQENNGNDRPDDRALVRAAKGGDLAAFEELVKRHERRIYGLARRMTGAEHEAQDVTQQTFLSAVKNLAGFREAAAFSTWLTAIAANAALKMARKRGGLPTSSLDEALEPDGDGHVPHPEYIADWRESPDRLALRAETHRLLDDAIAGLGTGQRAVFLLRDVEGLSVRDTARALEISEASVKVRLLRARMQLREKLTRMFGNESRRYKPGAHAHASGHAPKEKTHG
ncbi:MAG: sigma-70 family RNA polymerase sigma factor [Lentisphaerae bacterium]|nr:sigma-70 family RNA polymerase sigma factor [Lentisphaerota bacterium]